MPGVLWLELNKSSIHGWTTRASRETEHIKELSLWQRLYQNIH